MPQVGKSRPLTGWQHKSVIDSFAEQPFEKVPCDLCGTKIRWQHLLEHDDWSDTLCVGCCCAEKMSNHDVRGSEADAKKRAGRLRTFMNPDRWNISASGNPTRKLRNGLRVTVFESRYGVNFVINRKRRPPIFGSRSFSTETGAKRAAFDELERNG